jgi:hypothetical protein
MIRRGDCKVLAGADLETPETGATYAPFLSCILSNETKTVGGLADHPLPEDVRQLVLDHVESFEKLEILMLLREHPETGWTADSVSARLSLSSSSATAALRALHGSRLLDLRAGAEPVFRYAPALPKLARTVEGLAAVWEHDRLSVMKFMATSALERVRFSAVRAFADAFSLGGRNVKGKKNG